MDTLRAAPRVAVAAAGATGPRPADLASVTARIVSLVRAAQLLFWPLVLAAGAGVGVADLPLAVACCAVQSAWTILWCVAAVSARRIPAWSPAVDVLVTAACLVAGGLACFPQDAVTWANPAVTPAIGAALAVGAALPARLAAGAAAAIVAAYLGGVGRSLAHAAQVWPAVAADVALLVGAAALARLAVTVLGRADAGRRALGRDLDGARSDLAASRAELAVSRAQIAELTAERDERRRGDRLLHDTVLSTLSALARGGLDLADPLVRQRISADADYLRALISPAGNSAAARLQAALAGIARAQAGIGLRTQVHCAGVPDGTPQTVVDALCAAVREALNNVLKHSGVRQARVTAGPPADGGHGLVVTITDQGCGFDPTAARPGIGLRSSMAGRMSEVGGTMRLVSGPGQGTTVELRWPR